MKIVFVSPNRYQGYAKPPLGLLSVATVCRRLGHDASILDADLLNLCPMEVAERVSGADMVGLTAMTPTIAEAISIAKCISQQDPQQKIVLGGVHASIFPEEMAHTRLFDAVVKGEGEGPMRSIVKSLEHGKPLFPVYVSTNDDIAYPDYSLLPIAEYKPRYPHGIRAIWTCVSTSRGCPMACTFCSKAVSGRHYHHLIAANVADLVESLCKQGVRDITFYDDAFTFNKGRRLTDICLRLIDEHLDLTWTCEARVDSITPDILRQMKRAGCRMIFYGIESGNQDILNRLQKGTTLEEIHHAVELTRASGIKAAGYFMVGCPGETRGTMEQTLSFARSLALDHAQFSACSPLPGSALFEQYGDGYDWSSYQYLSQHEQVLITSKQVSRDDILGAVRRGNAMYAEKVVV